MKLRIKEIASSYIYETCIFDGNTALNNTYGEKFESLYANIVYMGGRFSKKDSLTGDLFLFTSPDIVDFFDCMLYGPHIWRVNKPISTYCDFSIKISWKFSCPWKIIKTNLIENKILLCKSADCYSVLEVRNLL